MLKRILSTLQDSPVIKQPSCFKTDLKKISQYNDSLANLDDEQFAQWISEFCAQLDGPLAEACKIKAFAYVAQAAHRLLSMNPFEAQLLAGMGLYEGLVIDMKTGEGKTLAAAAPAICDAVGGKKVFILTFNDYLAQRDASKLTELYECFGLSVGIVLSNMTTEQRKQAYQCDIIYVTAREVGFDFLRDQLVPSQQDKVLCAMDVAIVDEADSILVDEARIPLVISGDIHQPNEYLQDLAVAVRGLVKLEDWETDTLQTNVHLTENGCKKIEQQFDCDNLFDEESLHLLTSVNLALHAEVLLEADIDYIVKDNSIKLIDEFTGRIGENRRWPDGMQSALEAKEGQPVKMEGQTLGSITLQHLMCQFDKVSGMTGTAVLASDELYQLYQLKTLEIAPGKPCQRQDYPDRVFVDNAARDAAICEEIIKVHQKNQPILVGTPSIRESERLHAMLVEKGVDCCLLNAKNDADEADIVAQAGSLNAVTICTNLAGRGTDILLGSGSAQEKKAVNATGGLHIIGTSRFESRRIDDQLRGRAARQGDPGSSQFFVSLTDKLFSHFGGDGMFTVKELKKLDGSPKVTHKIAHSQRVIEGANLDRRKSLYKYSDLIEQQRLVVHQLRDQVLLDDGQEIFADSVSVRWQSLVETVGKDVLNKALRLTALHHIDKMWVKYLAEVDYIKEGIHLVGFAGTSSMFGGTEPYHVFVRQAQEVFEQLMDELKEEVVETFNKLEITADGIDPNNELLGRIKSTSSYVVVDNPFDGADNSFVASVRDSLKRSRLKFW